MTESQQQIRKSTPEEDIRELYSRTAKLNDAVSALLAPEWGANVGIIPEGHPLYPKTLEPLPSAIVKRPTCIHPDGYEGECPCPTGCGCCKVAPAEKEPTTLARLRRLRDQLAAEHAKAVAADQQPRPDLDLRVSPHNGIAAGLEIALHYTDKHLQAADAETGEAEAALARVRALVDEHPVAVGTHLLEEALDQQEQT